MNTNNFDYKYEIKFTNIRVTCLYTAKEDSGEKYENHTIIHVIHVEKKKQFLKILNKDVKKIG